MTDVNLLTCREMLTTSSPVEIRSAFSLRKECLTTKVRDAVLPVHHIYIYMQWCAQGGLGGVVAPLVAQLLKKVR